MVEIWGPAAERRENATRAPSLHHRAKNTKFCHGPRQQRRFILATFDLSRAGAFKHKCRARACRMHGSDPGAGMAVPPMTTTVTPTEERRRERGSHVPAKSRHTVPHQ